MDANRAAANLANKIGEIIFAPTGNRDMLAKAKAILGGIQKGEINRSLFTDNANAYFDKQCLRDLASSLAPLGAPTGFELVTEGLRGGMTAHRYQARFKKKTLEVSTYAMPDGKLEQYIVSAERHSRPEGVRSEHRTFALSRTRSLERLQITEAEIK